MADLEQEMASLLAELQQEGRLDSTGEFTIDFVRGMDKLRVYQLQSPRHYVLKLVQAAVAAGAARIDIEVRGNCLQVAYPAPPVEVPELEGLAGALLQPERLRGRRHLGHLAVALNSCLACEVDSLVVESWEGTRGSVLMLDEANQRTGTVTGPRPRGNQTRVVLRKRRGAWQFPYSVEETLLRQSCAYAGVPLFLNGSSLNRPGFGQHALPPWLAPFQPLIRAAHWMSSNLTNPLWAAHRSSINTLGRESPPPMPWWVWFWSVEDYVFGACHRNHHLLERHLRCPPAPLALALPPCPRASLAEVVQDEVEEEGESWAMPELGGVRLAPCRAALALEMDLLTDARLQFVQDGVLICTQSVDLDVIGAVGVISAEGLKTDISQFSLIEDEAYEERLRGLREQFIDMRARLKAILQADPRRTPLGKHVLSRLQSSELNSWRPRY